MAFEGKVAGLALIGLGVAGAKVGVPALVERVQDANIGANEHPLVSLVRLGLEAGNELIVAGAGIAGVVVGLIQFTVSSREPSSGG